MYGDNRAAAASGLDPKQHRERQEPVPSALRLACRYDDEEEEDKEENEVSEEHSKMMKTCRTWMRWVTK